MLRVLRNAIVVVVTTMVLFAVQMWRSVPNPIHAPAQQFALTLEAAYRSVGEGATTVEAYTGPQGILGGAFTTAPPFDLGGNAEPLVRSYEALVAIHADECYVVRWSPRQSIFTGVLAPDLPCEVHPRLTQVGLFTRSANQPADAPSFDWTQVLPPKTFLAMWFLPVMIGGLAIVLQALISITLALIRPAHTTVPPFSTADSEREVPPVPVPATGQDSSPD